MRREKCLRVRPSTIRFLSSESSTEFVCLMCEKRLELRYCDAMTCDVYGAARSTIRSQDSRLAPTYMNTLLPYLYSRVYMTSRLPYPLNRTSTAPSNVLALTMSLSFFGNTSRCPSSLKWDAITLNTTSKSTISIHAHIIEIHDIFISAR